MVFEHIENLKRIYTDQLVIVDDNRTELGRFQGLTGTVKTVNMSGRALVEFDGYNNIGWYDIDVDFLKLVDEPVHETETVSTPVPPAEAATPAAVETTTSTVETPAEKPAPAKADAGNMSVADMLASARASAAGEEAPAAVDTENMSVADMLAAARASAAGEETPTAEAPATEAPAEEQAAEEPQEAAAEDTPAEEPATAPAGDTGNAQALKETDDVDGMLDYCRKVDG